MMDIFRKYQRSLFIFVTTLVVASFLFFGAFSTYTESSGAQDRVIGVAVDGSDLLLSEQQKLARFLATDQLDAVGKEVFPNLCNDGVIRYDLLQTGLAEVIVRQNFEEMQETLQNRLERAKRFRPYAHPDAPFLSTNAVWQRLAPGLQEKIEKLQQEKMVSPELFQQFAELYQLSSRCPTEWVRRVLMLQLQQYSWLRPDPRLQTADLSPFGFHQLADWFGPHFLDLCSEFILNAARAAKQKGYQVSLEEAKADLLNHFTVAAEKIGQKELHFQSHLRELGFDERSAAEVWVNVLLFRRYFQGIGQACFIDRLPYSEFASYALEAVAVELYEWPPELRLKKFSDLIEFQVYTKAVGDVKRPLELPMQCFSIEEVEKTYPELIQTDYTAQVFSMSKEKIGLQGSVKEVWDWQLNHWEILKNRFPALPLVETVKTREERFAALEALTTEMRGQIDAYTRKMLVDEHPEWVEKALAQKGRECEIHLSSNRCSLAGIVKPQELTAALELAQMTQMPFRYCDDGATHYQILNVKKLGERHLLTYKSAKEQGILKRLLQRTLEPLYADMRTKAPKQFKKEDGSWKSFPEAYELVAREYYADLLKAIDVADPKEWKAGEGPLEAYAYRRLLPQTKEALESLQKQEAAPRWIASDGDPLLEQFRLQKKEQQIQRIAKEKWMKDEAFQLVPNQWSTIHVDLDGEICFFYFQEKIPHQAPILEQLVMGKEIIAADGMRFVAERLMEQMKRRKKTKIRGNQAVMHEGKNESI